MIQGVIIGDKHCQRDYGMLLASKTIGSPEVQTHYIDVPGRNGPIDFTEALSGGVHYSSRPIVLNFVTNGNISDKEWPDFLSMIANDIHGQKKQIVFDEDPDHYYVGRGEITSFSDADNKRSLSISFTCEPFKYDSEGKTSL